MQFDLFTTIGLYGLCHLDAILLAILALKGPVLLVGKQGSGKTMMARSIGMMMQLNVRNIHVPTTGIDDLTGLPMPVQTDDGMVLELINTSGISIWDADVIMLDEINRAIPVTINKLYNLINERELMGKKLHRLHYIFASINPPFSFDGENADDLDAFIGIFPLDQALLDRFYFIVYFPDYNEMDYDTQRLLIESGEIPSGNPTAIRELIDACQQMVETVEAESGDLLTNYTIYFARLMHQAKVSLSGRRVKILRMVLAYVHSANIILSGDRSYPFEDSMRQAVFNGIPQLAQEDPPVVQIMAAHKQAIEIASLGSTSPDVQQIIIQFADPVDRVIAARQKNLDEELYSMLITNALSSQRTPGDHEALAVAFYVTHHQTHNLTAQAYEVLVSVAAPLFRPATMTLNRNQIEHMAQVDALLSDDYADSPHRLLMRNFALAYMPLWEEVDCLHTVRRLKSYIDQLESA